MNYQVIARKWRPKTFADVVGQQHVTRTLQNAIRSRRVAHAYIFSGVRGVGKTTTARILAKALDCEKGPAAEPCNVCDRCKEITAGNSLDVLEIDAASNRGIDQIRELREMVRYAPATGRYKVVILDEAHQLTEEASNALLKTLEEPPEQVIFILATTAPGDLPETIRSRTQHLHFRSLSFGEIASSLERITRAEGVEIEPGALAVLARSAEGSLRDGLSLLEQAITFCERAITDREVRELLGVVSEETLDEMIEAFASASSEKALALVHRIILSGNNLESFCREAIRHVRNLLVVRVAGIDSPMVTATSDERPRLQRQAALFSDKDLTRFFQILLSTQADLQHYADPRLHLEMGLLRSVSASTLVPLEELLAELRNQASPASHPGSAAPAAPRSSPQQDPRNLENLPPSRLSPAASPAGKGGLSVTDLKASLAQNPYPAGPLASDRVSDARPAWAPRTLPQSSSASEPPSEGAAKEIEMVGVCAADLKALRASIEQEQQQKFLASLLDHVTRWEVAGTELRLYFPPEKRSLAEMLHSREVMERLRSVASQVLGRPLRVCVKLGFNRLAEGPASIAVGEGSGPESTGARSSGSELERKAAVRSVLDRFGGRISRIRPAGGS